MNMRSILAGVAAYALLWSSVAQASGIYVNGSPVAGGTQYPSTIPLTGNEQIPADTELPSGENPQSEAITTQQLSAYDSSKPSLGNALIGGDPTTNLFQRGTAGTSTTSTTPAYDSPDRFAQWSTSAGAGVQLSRDSASTDVFAGYLYSIKFAHSNTSAGQICMGQEVKSSNSYQFAGNTAEFDFHAYLGAGYTGGSTLTAYIVYGTGTDDGMAKMAYTVNGAGTSPGWAGGVLATSAVVPLSTVSTGGRFSAVASIPSTATEVGVALCYTASTTDSNDYVAVAGLQLARNPANAAIASATAAYNCANEACVAFQRRPAEVEAALQYAYFYQWNETVSGYEAAPGACEAYSTTVAVCSITTPVTMRTANPTTTCTIGTLKRSVAGAPTALSAFAASTGTTYGIVSGSNALACIATVASGDTAGFAGILSSGDSTGGGLVSGSSEL